MFWADHGGGAFMNERRLRVAARREIKDAVFATGIPFAAVPPARRLAFARTLGALMPQVAGIRRFGAAALDLAWVAAGRFDGYWELGLAALGLRGRHPDRARGWRLCHRRRRPGSSRARRAEQRHRGREPGAAPSAPRGGGRGCRCRGGPGGVMRTALSFCSWGRDCCSLQVGASAQVAVNSGALNQLRPEHAQPAPPRHSSARTTHHPAAPAHARRTSSARRPRRRPPTPRHPRQQCRESRPRPRTPP